MGQLVELFQTLAVGIEEASSHLLELLASPIQIEQGVTSWQGILQIILSD